MSYVLGPHHIWPCLPQHSSHRVAVMFSEQYNSAQQCVDLSLKESELRFKSWDVQYLSFRTHTISCHKDISGPPSLRWSCAAVSTAQKEPSWSQLARWPRFGFDSDLWTVWVTAEREGVDPRTVNGLFEWKEYTSCLLFYTRTHTHTVGTHISACGQTHHSNACVENAHACTHGVNSHTLTHTENVQSKQTRRGRNCKWPWQH